MPFKRVVVHVQDPPGTAVPNGGPSTNDAYNEDVPVGNMLFGANSHYPYSWPPVYTDANGDATLWLLPNGP